ncbi:CBS domain-containing protein [Heyndrickxia acidicola]|uniref:CBS domain-containing protein n=1 Tax=Heyndrickxia acidicola TaxID=209389 RepID=A0ABU6MGP1_9BACI|nr:CBS domain-containing protein [Heyndrickxia acidicola]MED1203557.1 CBS domain-containing protein [Heyndrickxia acidicola]
MQVRNVMSSEVECCNTQDTLSAVASKMQSLNVGALPVVENENIIGMVTDRDMVVRGLTNGNSGDSVHTVMSSNVVTVSADASLEEAAQLMSQHQVRRLPVVDNGHLVGIVSLGDLAVRNQADHSAGQALSQISQQDLS